MKTYWGSRRVALCIFNLDRCEWSASLPGRLTPGEGASGTHWLGGWLGPTAGLDAVAKRKKSLPFLEIEPRSSSPKPSRCTH